MQFHAKITSDSFGCRYFKNAKEENDPQYLEGVRKWKVYFERVSRDGKIYNEAVGLIFQI